jgi:hypothetical protein
LKELKKWSKNSPLKYLIFLCGKTRLETGNEAQKYGCECGSSEKNFGLERTPRGHGFCWEWH